VSEIKIKPTKEFLQCLAENFEDITRKVNIEIIMESDKFIGEKEEQGEEYIEIEPDMGLIMKLNTLAPFLIVLYDTEIKGDFMKVKNARFHFNLDYVPVRAKCPFCGHEQDYVANFVPYAYPYNCRCGASVGSDFGGTSDVAEGLSLYAELVEPHPELLKIPFRNILQAKDKKGRDIIALQVDMDEDGDGTWLVFHQKS